MWLQHEQFYRVLKLEPWQNLTGPKKHLKQWTLPWRNTPLILLLDVGPILNISCLYRNKILTIDYISIGQEKSNITLFFARSSYITQCSLRNSFPNNRKLRCATIHKRYNLHKLSLKANPIVSNPLLCPLMCLQLLY